VVAVESRLVVLRYGTMEAVKSSIAKTTSVRGVPVS